METEDFPADKITYDISVDYGEYLAPKYFGNTSITEILDSGVIPAPAYVGKEFTVVNNTRIYWQGISELATAGAAMDVVYTKIIIRCEENIIGYAILRFDRAYGRDVIEAYPELSSQWAGKEDEPAAAYWSNLIASVSFPRVDGTYQNVPESYVNECIQDVINGQ